MGRGRGGKGRDEPLTVGGEGGGRPSLPLATIVPTPQIKLAT